MTQQIKHPGITLVLGTGLLKAAAALGVAQVLERENIPISAVIGSSTGALFAAAIALGWTAQKTQDFFTRIAALHKLKAGTSSNGLRRLLAGLSKSSSAEGIVDPVPYYDIIREEFGEKKFSDAQLPLQLVATNFVNGQRILASEGPLWPYLQASAGIPGFLPPIHYQGQHLSDGALAEPFPISAAALNSPLILGVGFELTLLDNTSTQLEYAYQLNAVMVKNLLNLQMALNNLAQHSEIVLINPRFGVVVELIDLQYIPFIIEKGAEATQQIIPYLRSVLSYE